MQLLKRKVITLGAVIAGFLTAAYGVGLAVIHLVYHLLGIDHPF